MSSSPFPLFRLPFVALKEVIEKVEVKQLIPLSFCSKKMHYTVKRLRNKRGKITIRLYGRRDIFIEIENEISLDDRTDGVILVVKAAPEGGIKGWKTDRVGGKVAHFQEHARFRDRDFTSYWEDVVYGTKSIIEYITNLFGVHVHHVVFEDDSVWMMDFIEELQGPKTYNASIQRSTNRGLTDEQFRHILTDLNPTDLDLFQIPSNDFRLESFQKNYEILMIAGTWLTIENLRQLDCIRLEAGQTEFTTLEINRFLKHVLAGGASNRWKQWSIAVRNSNENEILNGIPELLTAAPERDSFGRDEKGWHYRGNIIRGDELVLVKIDYDISRREVTLIIGDGYACLD